MRKRNPDMMKWGVQGKNSTVAVAVFAPCSEFSRAPESSDTKAAQSAAARRRPPTPTERPQGIPQGSKARIRILWEMGVKKKKKAICNIDLFYLLYIYTLYTIHQGELWVICGLRTYRAQLAATLSQSAQRQRPYGSGVALKF